MVEQSKQSKKGLIVLSVVFLVLFCITIFYLSSISKQTDQLKNKPQEIINNEKKEIKTNNSIELYKTDYNGHSYNDLAVPEANKFKGQTIELTGLLATNLSQIDGVKFWILDKDHNYDNNEKYEWFWATTAQPEQLPTKYNGSWTHYMFEKYAGLNSENIDFDKTAFTVKGKFLGQDCTFYNKETFGKTVCIPNVAVESISLASKLITL